MVRYYKRENKNGISYQARIRIKGYKDKVKTFKLKSDAQAWAEPIEIAMKNGTYKDVDLSIANLGLNIDTIADLIDFFKSNIASERYSYSEKYNVMYDWWKDKIGNVKVSELTSSMLASCKQILMSEIIKKKDKEIVRSNNTINKYLMCMSAVLTYATDELELYNINPMKRIKILQKPNSRTRFLSDDEIKALKRACFKHSLLLYLFYMISLKTGGRFNEVRHLQVKDLDYKNNRVYFLDTKNNTHRAVHLDSKILRLTKKYLEKNGIYEGYIFRSNVRGAELADMKGILEKAIKDAGIKNFRIHDIRHTHASILAEKGASLLEIAEVLGQKSLTVARNYSHLTRKHTENLLASIMDKY